MKELFWLASICLLIWVGALFINQDDENATRVADVQQAAIEVAQQAKADVAKAAAALQAQREDDNEESGVSQVKGAQGNGDPEKADVASPVPEPARIVEEQLPAQPVAAVAPAPPAMTPKPVAQRDYAAEKRWEAAGRSAGERALAALEKANEALGR